jgi:hypothetical protein
MNIEASSSGRLLSRREVARLLNVAEGTLAHWAAAGTGPAFARSGPVRGRCWYAEADVHAWVLERRHARGGTGVAADSQADRGRAGQAAAAVSEENHRFL